MIDDQLLVEGQLAEQTYLGYEEVRMSFGDLEGPEAFRMLGRAAATTGTPESACYRPNMRVTSSTFVGSNLI